LEYRSRFFRTKTIAAGSKLAITSALKASKNSLFLQSEHLEEAGSGWLVQHCRRLDLIITSCNGIRGGKSNLDTTKENVTHRKLDPFYR